MQTLRDLLDGLPAPAVLLVVGLLVTAESGLLIGVVLPGTTGLLLLGFFAYLGVVPLVPAVLVGLVAALGGTTMAYLSGRRLGSRLLDLVRVRRINGVVIACGQWVVVSRTVLPRLAGSTGWSYGRFARCNVPSAVVWGVGMVIAGFLAGHSVTAVATYLGWAGAGILGAAVLGYLVVMAVRRRTREARA